MKRPTLFPTSFGPRALRPADLRRATRPASTPTEASRGRSVPRKPVLLLAAIVLPTLLAACTGDRQDAERPLLEVATSDDGVPTLHIRSLWEAESHPTASVRVDTIISPEEGDHISLVAPAHAALWDDGRVVLGDAGTRRTWIRNREGTWSEGPGPWEGPNQIMNLAGVWPGGLAGLEPDTANAPAPDSEPDPDTAPSEGFVVHDVGTGELVAFSPTGSALARTRIGSEQALHGAGVSTGPWPSALHPLADGSWVAKVAAPNDGPDQNGVLAGTIRYTWVSGPTLDQETPLGEGPALPFRVMGGGAAPLPFAGIGHLAAAGRRIGVHHGDGARVSLSDVDTDGTLTPTLHIEWHDDSVQVTDTHRERVEAFLLEMAPGDMSDEDRDGWLVGLMDTFIWPEVLPPLGALHLTPSGDLWIASPLRTGLDMPPRPERMAEWRVVSTYLDGEPNVRRVTLPEGVITVLGPAGAAHPGAVLVLLRDPSERQGLGLLELGPHDSF